MNKGLVIGAAILIVVVLGLPLFAQLAKKNAPPKPAPAPEAPPAPPPAPTPAPRPFPTNLSPPAQSPGAPGIPNFQIPPEVQPGVPYRIAPEIPAAQAPKLNAQNLAGSEWEITYGEIQGARLQLQPGGMAIMRHPQMPPQMQANGFPASWSVNGPWMRLCALGYIIEVQIVGDRIMGPNGQSLRRIR